ncbi:MAG: hypothetical protein AAGJ82_15505 [Bacteroidota bacterium]
MQLRITYLALTLAINIGTTMAQDSLRVAFYNVENLFDTVDDPERKDEEFLPTGRKQWTDERYQAKLARLTEVFQLLDAPAILGVCEVENARVLRDWVNYPGFSERTYDFVHCESPDVRGIDAALLYDAERFSLVSSSRVRVDFPLWLEPEGYTSRDIIVAELADTDGQRLHLFVNHWPSRRGGTEASQHRRWRVAAALRQAVAEVQLADSSAQIILLGDFNDEPHNTSVSQALGSLPYRAEQSMLPGLLYNLFAHQVDTSSQDIGTYNYKGDWNALDQFIVTGFTGTAHWQIGQATIFRDERLLYKGKRPNRTYGGSNYYGGFSDHLPIVLDLYHE